MSYGLPNCSTKFLKGLGMKNMNPFLRTAKTHIQTLLPQLMINLISFRQRF